MHAHTEPGLLYISVRGTPLAGRHGSIVGDDICLHALQNGCAAEMPESDAGRGLDLHLMEEEQCSLPLTPSLASGDNLKEAFALVPVLLSLTQSWQAKMLNCT